MKKPGFIAAILLIILTGCKKSNPNDDYTVPNLGITATSSGTFNITVTQLLYKTGLQYKEFNYEPISNYDKELLVSRYDQLSVTVTNATAPVHLHVTYYGSVLDDEQNAPGIDFNTTIK